MYGDYPGFSFGEISDYEVLKLVKDMKISKSSAYSQHRSRLFKDAFLVLINELTHCLNTGHFPSEWGLAEVTPIPKVRGLHKVKN